MPAADPVPVDLDEYDFRFTWQGWSGRQHVTKVFDICSCEYHEPGVWMLVRREPANRRMPLLIGAAPGDVSDHLYRCHGDLLMRAIKAGATEVHVSCASTTSADLAETLDDLAFGLGIQALPREAPTHNGF